jgi:cell division topological specificity factor
MKLLSFFTRPATAPVARERLQLLLAHERAAFGRSELLEMLRTEILQVIAKHVAVDKDKVKVIVGSLDGVATLEVDIEIRAPSDVPLDEMVRKVA